ncbi:MAG: glutaminase A [Pseudomonadota bacterium]
MAPDGVNLEDHRRDSFSAQIFDAVVTSGKTTISADDLFAALRKAGLKRSDRRLSETRKALERDKAASAEMDLEAFSKRLAPENTALILRALRGDLIIPDFADYKHRMENIFEYCRDFDGGGVATYIPQLARVNPENYAVAACTVDGQQFSFGDDDESYCVQSTCKPINYAIALDGVGRHTVHRHVGREPSGQSFNELTLNDNGLPHNPMINAGAIMCASLIKPHHPLADRFDHIMSIWRSLGGGRNAGFDNSVYLSEKATADRNFALAYFMREKGAFPADTNIMETLDFYFQCCSITVDVRQMGVIAATLANGGVCPLTSQRVFQSETVKDCLSLMYSCGMYDFSGEYAFTVGIPAKSGVSGAIFLVVPGVCGIALWSPRLDRLGNSVRGIEFSKRLVEVFAFHTYANMVNDHRLIDPRKSNVERNRDEAALLCAAAARGDIGEVRRLVAAEANLDAADYDGRTPLHLAASEGAEAMVDFLIEHCACLDPVDRWGNTPIDDAKRRGADTVASKLENAIGQRN